MKTSPFINIIYQRANITKYLEQLIVHLSLGIVKRPEHAPSPNQSISKDPVQWTGVETRERSPLVHQTSSSQRPQTNALGNCYTIWGRSGSVRVGLQNGIDTLGVHNPVSYWQGWALNARTEVLNATTRMQEPTIKVRWIYSEEILCRRYQPTSVSSRETNKMHDTQESPKHDQSCHHEYHRGWWTWNSGRDNLGCIYTSGGPCKWTAL